MATKAQCEKFIKEITPLIQKYALQYGYKVVSPIIAQACCESAFGTSLLGYKYNNYFGMKCGTQWKCKSVNLKTGEEYTPGVHTTIKANFRVYSSMDDGVKGYFDFISSARYTNLKYATTPKQYLEYIKADGYATSSTYVNTNMNIVKSYNLTEYDNPIYFPKYTGKSKSIVEALKAVGTKDTTFTYRRKIANANAINLYIGTATQNTLLLTLLKQGKLIKP